MTDQNPPPAAAAEAAVVACLDPRFQKLLDQFREEHGLNGARSTPHHPPGASLNIESELERLDLAVHTLGAKQIHILDHQEPGCKAYALKYGSDYDKGLHQKHLTHARQLLQERYPEVEVHTYIMRLPGEIKKIS